MKFFTIRFLCVFALVSGCRQKVQNVTAIVDNRLEIQQKKTFDFLPSSTTKAVYHHSSYSFSYSEKHEQSEWVAYSLSSKDLGGINYERPYFAKDPIVKTGSAHWNNYKKSGYDKGHLCPAGDRKASIKDYNETFYMSNAAPQKHGFNSGIWNRLEEKVRYWAKKYDGIYVVTAGVLSKNMKTIGTEKVAVPDYFYKVILSKDQTRMIAFLVPHQESKKPLYEFVISVDELEKLTGIDFFPQLDDALENRLEAKKDYKDWAF